MLLRPRASKPLGPRVAELAAALSSDSDARRTSAISELALLVSCSQSARGAVAAGEIEGKLLTVLSQSSDTNVQCWIMSILSNLASDRASRERQAVAVPSLVVLLKSHAPEVTHAAALHLARLSHSDFLRTEINKAGGLSSLHTLEKSFQKTELPPLNGAGVRTAPAGRLPPVDRVGLLKQETAQYARWTLRTAQGRNYKQDFKPKSAAEIAQDEASVVVQKHVRGRAQREWYEHEKEDRGHAATKMQAAHRGKTDRAYARDKASEAAQAHFSTSAPLVEVSLSGGPVELGTAELTLGPFEGSDGQSVSMTLLLDGLSVSGGVIEIEARLLVQAVIAHAVNAVCGAAEAAPAAGGFVVQCAHLSTMVSHQIPCFVPAGPAAGFDESTCTLTLQLGDGPEAVPLTLQL